MVDLLESEYKLAQKLKELCDVEGKELHPKKSAELIYQLGLVYKDKSPDKFSLIKCAGLLNAAMARKPSNVDKIQRDLLKVNKLVLNQAKAKNQNANLIKQSVKVKRSINHLRKEVSDLLDELNDKLQATNMETNNAKTLEEERILGMQNIQLKITNDYCEIMRSLCEYCENVMGKPPCDYAVTGMGSLARKEITPYSDLEHVILLEDLDHYEANLEYFRWYSVIFHVILLNLQETIIPSLHIRNLNDADSQLGDWFFDAFTHRGISFDGMMPHACKFPLGRQDITRNKPWTTELIKPVTVMLKYLGSEKDLQNGYHLSDILTKTCFVFGDRTIYVQFVKGINEYIKKQTQDETTKTIRNQVKEDLDKFSTRFRLVNLKDKATKKLNIKEVVYRSSSLFISALGRLNHISENSCFDIIVELAKLSKISENTKHKLLFAMAIACQTRLTVYMKKKSQIDEIDIQTFLEILGPSVTLNFFQITYCLQCEIAKVLKFTKFHFYSKPHLINITFCYAFNLNQSAASLLGKYFTDDNFDLNKYNFDVCLKTLENQPKKIFQTSDILLKAVVKVVEISILPFIAIHLYVAGLYDEAIEFYDRVLDLFQSMFPKVNLAFARAYLNKADCLVNLQNPNAALISSLKSLKFYQTESLQEHTAEAFEIIGRCYQKLEELKHSRKYFNKALDIYKEISIDTNTDGNIAKVLSNIGCCCFSMKEYDTALVYFQEALAIYVERSEDENHCESHYNFLYNVISAFSNNDFETSRWWSLEVYQSQLLDEENKKVVDSSIASTLYEISHCHFKKKEFNTALKYFKKANLICQKPFLDIEKNTIFALPLDDRYCLVAQEQCTESLDHLQDFFVIYYNLHQEKEKKEASIYTLVGRCLLKLKQYEHASSFFGKSIAIFQNVSKIEMKMQAHLATLYVNSAYCSMQVNDYEIAIDQFNAFTDVYQTLWYEQADKTYDVVREVINYSLQHHTDKAPTSLKKCFSVASVQDMLLDKDEKEVNTATLCYICLSKCMMPLQRFKAAIDCLRKALDVHQSRKHELDEIVAALFTMIGSYSAESEQYESALCYLNRALAVFQQTLKDFFENKIVADVLRMIAIVYSKTNHFQDAVTFFGKAQEIYQHSSLGKEKLATVATTLYLVGCYLKNLEQYDNALNCFLKCLRILLTASLDVERDEDVGETLRNVGHCLQSLKQYNDAFNHFNRSLNIFQRLPCKTGSFKNTIHDLLQNINQCKQKS